MKKTKYKNNQKGQKILFRKSSSETFFKVSVLGLLFLTMFSIPSIFAGNSDVNLNQLQEDNFDYSVEYPISNVFSATSSGILSGNPDIQKQFKLYNGLSSLYYPIYHKDSYVVYEFYSNKIDTQNPLFKIFNPNGLLSTSLPGQLFFVDKIKVKVSGSGLVGLSKKLDISKYMSQGAVLVKIKVYYISQNKKTSLVQGPIRPDTNSKVFRTTGQVQLKDKSVGFYTCKGNDAYWFYQLSSGGSDQRYYTTCDLGCSEIGKGQIDCKKKPLPTPKDIKQKINLYNQNEKTNKLNNLSSGEGTGRINMIYREDVKLVNSSSNCASGYGKIQFSGKTYCAPYTDSTLNDSTNKTWILVVVGSVLFLFLVLVFKPSSRGGKRK